MKRKKILLGVLIIVILLLVPVIFKKKKPAEFYGPDLSELKYSEIFFDNDTEGFKLAGMLMVPEGEGPFPAAVILHGSGPSRRNNKWYLSVTKYLQDNGIAVLLPDKRGCEKSEGEWRGATFEELATDTRSAVEFVKNQQMFECSGIGLIGMSQGGWIAPIAAAETDDVSFVVSMSGAAVTFHEQLLHEEINNIGHYTYPFLAKLIAPMTTNNLEKKDNLIANVKFDPIPYWKRVHVPVFFAYGGNDENVPVDACVDRLKENGLDHYKIKIYPDGGHGIVDTKAKKVNEEFLSDLVDFIDSLPFHQR